MSNLQDVYISLIEDDSHNIRTPYDRSKGQIQNIIDLCEKVNQKTGKNIFFDNTWSNHYVLSIDENKYEFNVYRDVINALNILLLFI